METKIVPPQRKERVAMAHKLETPQHLNLALRESAEKIGESKPEELIDNLVIFKQNVIDFITYFDMSFTRIKSDMEDKKTEKGGFTSRAVQKHPYLGVKGLRLVRDELSDGVFLKENQTRLYYQLLNRKLFEETVEMVTEMNRDKRYEEVGDVLEVFSTILGVRGIDEVLIEDRRQVGEIELRHQKRKLSRKK